MSEFGKLNLEEMPGEDKRVNTERNAGFMDQFVPMPKPKAGQTGMIQVRILPPKRGSKLFEYTRIHNINGRKVHCPKRLYDGKWDKNSYNPIVDYYNGLWREADKLEQAGRKADAEDKKTEARSIKPIERYYYNAIIRKMTDENGQVLTDVGPRILSVGKVLHKMIIRAIVGDETEAPLGDITDPVNGYDFIIKVETRADFPNYDRSCFAREPSPLGTPEQIQVWAENLQDLSKCHVVFPAEVLEKELAIHRGLIPDDNQGFDVNKFDAQYKKQTNTASVSEADAVAKVVGHMVDPNDISDEVSPPPAQDVSIEDAEFLKGLSDMEEGKE